MRGGNNDAEKWRPTTTSRAQLLNRGRDDNFRELVNNMVRLSGVLEKIREGFAQHMNVTPPQYSLLMHLAACEGGEITTSQLAALLDVTLAFVVTESNKLCKDGLVERRRNPRDARSVLISLSQQGRQRIIDAAPMIRRVNDQLFAALTRESMRTLGEMHAALLENAVVALAILAGARQNS